MTNKYEAVMDFLQGYPEAPKFFNVIEYKNNSISLEPLINDACIKKYVDGAKEKEFKFSIGFIKELSEQPYNNKNLEDFFDIGTFMEWIEEQNEKKNFPNFGELCDIFSMENMQDTPIIEGKNQALIKYAFSVKIKYVERRKKYV